MRFGTSPAAVFVPDLLGMQQMLPVVASEVRAHLALSLALHLVCHARTSDFGVVARIVVVACIVVIVVVSQVTDTMLSSVPCLHNLSSEVHVWKRMKMRHWVARGVQPELGSGVRRLQVPLERLPSQRFRLRCLLRRAPYPAALLAAGEVA